MKIFVAHRTIPVRTSSPTTHGMSRRRCVVGGVTVLPPLPLVLLLLLLLSPLLILSSSSIRRIHNSPSVNILVRAIFSTKNDIIVPSFIPVTSNRHLRRYTNKSNYRYHRCHVMVHQSSTKTPVTSTISSPTSPSSSFWTTTATSTSSNGSILIGTDPMTKPNYDQMIGPFGSWVDEFCLTLFRNQLRDEVLRSYAATNASDNNNTIAKKLLRADPMYYGKANYTQIVALAAAMNARYQPTPVASSSRAIQQSAQNVLIALFPKWLPKWYRILFAQPFPILSAQMNAYVTAALGVWLMGECTVNDIDMDTTATTATTTTTTTTPAYTGKNQGVLVTRCRFLEESQCASVCIHSCKIPTQNFFAQQMGVPLLMEPNYTTGSCQFSFGRLPNTTTETTLIQTPCLSRCPTSGSYRQRHSGSTMKHPSTTNLPLTLLENVHLNNITVSESPICSMIEDI